MPAWLRSDVYALLSGKMGLFYHMLSGSISSTSRYTAADLILAMLVYYHSQSNCTTAVLTFRFQNRCLRGQEMIERFSTTARKMKRGAGGGRGHSQVGRFSSYWCCFVKHACVAERLRYCGHKL